MSDFVHLRVHSDYSLLDGVCRITLPKELRKQPNPPPTLPASAKELGFDAIALTDTNVMFGSLEFYRACLDVGVRPILGAELALHAPSPSDAHAPHAPDPKIVLLVQNETGYQNLIQLISLAQEQQRQRPGRPFLRKDQLAGRTEGLIGLSGGFTGDVARALLQRDETGARQRLREYRDLFAPDTFFVELNDHGIDDERLVNRFLIEQAAALGLPLVATNDVRYIRKSDAAIHDVLLCIQTGSLRADEKRPRAGSDDYYLRPAAEMVDLFRDCPEAIANTRRIADLCRFEVKFGVNRYPSYKLSDGGDTKAYLRNLCFDGLRRRYAHAYAGGAEADAERAALEERLSYELSVLEKTGFNDYFLIVWDFIHFAKQNDIPVGPGRGSAAGSLVAYTLAITDVDPIRFGLLFERFLNPERVSPPDIDVDFCQNRRGEVIEYVRKKYGEPCVAQIITFGTIGARLAVRDVVRVLGKPFRVGDRLSKMIPGVPGTTIQMAIDENPELKQAYEAEEETREVVDLARALEGLNRNTGVHAAGVVIADHPISQYVPLALSSEGDRVTQYDMNMLTEIGMLKMDFLGLKTLTVIQDALDLIESTTQQRIHPLAIPMSDDPTFRLLNQGQNVGVFQVESSGMRDLCRKFQIASVDDIVALIALFRPGPLELIPNYIDRKKGEAPIEYEHPLLEQCCADTYGIMIYQEQVMKAASVIGGYSLGGADLLRRAMGKKDAEKMAKERSKFIEGAARLHAIERDRASRIFDLLEKFAGYGFNKSHSAAYGIVSYQTAFLKANFPVPFMAALMSNEIGKTDKIAIFGDECRELGIPILPPCVNRSEPKFSVDSGAIRYGLAAIKNVGADAVARLVEERRAHGPFKDLHDLCRRVDTRTLNKKNLESLIKAGALDTFDPNRARITAVIDSAIAAASGSHRDAQLGQGALFDTFAIEPAPVAVAIPSTPDWPLAERLAYEREHLGIYITGHPLEEFKPILDQVRRSRTTELGPIERGVVVRVGGLIEGVEFRFTREKRMFGKARLLDELGTMDLFVAPDDVERFREGLIDGRAVLAAGTVDNRPGERPSLRLLELLALDSLPFAHATRVDIRVPHDLSLTDFGGILKAHIGPCAVRLILRRPDGFEAVLELHTAFAIQPSRAFQSAVEALTGPGALHWTLRPDIPLPKSRFGPRSAQRRAA